MKTIAWERLKSEEDSSVNFIKRKGDEIIEARFVQRDPEYFIIYLSSHTGCNKACRFCHLTQTKQTGMRPLSFEEYREQVNMVFQYYDSLKFDIKPTRVNFNWMARGEALCNDIILNDAHKLTDWLTWVAEDYGLRAKFNLSTIMPKEMVDVDLYDTFKGIPINFYYSLYSMDDKFRKRWIPKALDPYIALDKLAEWQQKSGMLITFHWPFIEGENDSKETVETICDEITKRNIIGKFNLVRYNPYSSRQGKESSDEVIQRNFDIISKKLNHPSSRIIPRVGHDVKCSCGMFIE